MDRRHFHKLCGGLLSGAASLHVTNRARAAASDAPYPHSKLIYEDGSPVLLASLKPGVAYIFGYPYITTPCFLVRLNRSSPARGSWPGGLDEDQSVVAFSAICSHKMSHPAKPISHISYREQEITYYDKSGQKQTRDGVISCCSERSVYDPASAGDVMAGPAPAPLAAIALSNDDNGHVSATGSFGDNQYERFLTKFGFRLAMEYGVSDIRARSGEQCRVVRADTFSAQQVLC
ncbi:MAG: hypothetical protein AB8B64_14900 [Granulosicoccus sp.]